MATSVLERSKVYQRDILINAMPCHAMPSGTLYALKWLAR